MGYIKHVLYTYYRAQPIIHPKTVDNKNVPWWLHWDVQVSVQMLILSLLIIFYNEQIRITTENVI